MYEKCSYKKVFLSASLFRCRNIIPVVVVSNNCQTEFANICFERTRIQVLQNISL